MNQVVGEICRRIWVYHERILGKEVGGWMDGGIDIDVEETRMAV